MIRASMHGPPQQPSLQYHSLNPAEVGGTLSSAAAAMYELVESHSEKRATDAAALRHAP
jgi:hypothetical protein